MPLHWPDCAIEGSWALQQVQETSSRPSQQQSLFATFVAGQLMTVNKLAVMVPALQQPALAIVSSLAPEIPKSSISAVQERAGQGNTDLPKCTLKQMNALMNQGRN